MSGRGAVARKKIDAEIKRKKEAKAAAAAALNERPLSELSDPADAGATSPVAIPAFPSPPPQQPAHYGYGPPPTPGMMSPHGPHGQFYGPQMAVPMVMGPQGWVPVQPGYMGGVMPPPPPQGNWGAGAAAAPAGYSSRPRQPSVHSGEDVGVEKSGFRSMMDKQTDGVRRGLAKTFNFRKKDKDGGGGGGGEHAERARAERPPSSTTVRPLTMTAYETGSEAAESSSVSSWPANAASMSSPAVSTPATTVSSVASEGRSLRVAPPLTIPEAELPQSPTSVPGPGSAPGSATAASATAQNPYQPRPLPSPTSPHRSWASAPIGPPPTTKLPPIPSSASATSSSGGTREPPIRRWIGGGRPVKHWNKLRKDPELWDPHGDVLVYLGRRSQNPRPQPSFRLSSHIIEATGSRQLITMLREGAVEDEEALHLHPPGRTTSNGHLAPGREPLTPPVSEDAGLGELEGQISYEMFFAPPSAPGAATSRLEQLRHMLTTRNVFALLHHASLVGLTLHQALVDLQARLDALMPPGSDNVGALTRYLTARGIDDVRSEPASAVSLLAWSEGPAVRWADGWREAFLHCAGMYGDLERCADFRHTTPIARALLERASLEAQLRVQAAEERLAAFDFEDMWEAAGVEEDVPARAAAERLRERLVSHYEGVYGSWPPPPPPPTPKRKRRYRTKDGVAAEEQPEATDACNEYETWLTRTVAMALRRDFGALYDYIVDRDVAWDVSEARSGRKWVMASGAGAAAGFDPDTPDLPMTDMLVTFDSQHRYPHVPHPYPLVPTSIPPAKAGSGKDSPFKKPDATGGGRSGALERRVQLAYTESTNIYALGSDFAPSELVDVFVRFEKSDAVGALDPAEGRRGRWVLLYAILQTLATVSVDDERGRYTDGVPYHLGPRLKGARTPPWKGSRRGDTGEQGRSRSRSMGATAHERSHCWITPQSWGWSGSASGSGGQGPDTDDEEDEETKAVMAEYLVEGC